MIADSAFAQPPSESEGHHSVRPQSPSSYRPTSPNGHPKPLGETLRPKEPPSPAVYPDKARGPGEGPVSKRSSSLLNSLRPPLPLQAKEGPHSVNGRTKPWDSFTPEEFAQQFHESVLQSTQKALQKHKGKQHGPMGGASLRGGQWATGQCGDETNNFPLITLRCRMLQVCHKAFIRSINNLVSNCLEIYL